MKVLIAAGTRPEAIKLAPVVQALRRGPRSADTLLCATGQHREMFAQALDIFGLAADVDLQVMTVNQGLSGLTARILEAVTPVLEHFQPDWVVVQGDTTTTMAAALAAFYLKIPVAHVEAGLRTGDRFHPFPEEANRKITDVIAELLCAPTEYAAAQLRAEGCPDARILVTGNTGIDALLQVAAAPESPRVRQLRQQVAGRRMVLVTTHRRENFGAPLTRICAAIQTLVDRDAHTCVVLPVHPNPNVAAAVHERLANHPGILLTTPLEYADFVAMMTHAALILSDSGGVQEEAPSLGIPVLVLRDSTERQEAVRAGTARLVGTDTTRIVDAATALLNDAHARQAMVSQGNPFGDGHASARIVDALWDRLPHRR